MFKIRLSFEVLYNYYNYSMKIEDNYSLFLPCQLSLFLLNLYN